MEMRTPYIPILDCNEMNKIRHWTEIELSPATESATVVLDACIDPLELMVFVHSPRPEDLSNKPACIKIDWMDELCMF